MSKNVDDKFPVKRKVDDATKDSEVPSKKRTKKQSLFTAEMSDLDMAYDGWLMKAPANADKLKSKSKRRGSAQKRAQARKSGAPRKALNSYSIFFREQREVIVAEREANKQPKIDFEELGREVGRRWKKLSEPELQRFKRLADADTARYKAELAAYEEAQQKPKKASSLPEMPTSDYQQVSFPPPESQSIKTSSSYPFLVRSRVDHRDYRDYQGADHAGNAPPAFRHASQEWSSQGMAANADQDPSFLDSKMPAVDDRPTHAYHQADAYSAQRRLSGQEGGIARRSSESSVPTRPGLEGVPFAQAPYQHSHVEETSMHGHSVIQGQREYPSPEMDVISPSIFDQYGTDFHHRQQSHSEQPTFQSTSRPFLDAEEGAFSPPSINDPGAQDLFWEPRPIAPGFEADATQDTKNDDEDPSEEKSEQNPW